MSIPIMDSASVILKNPKEKYHQEISRLPSPTNERSRSTPKSDLLRKTAKMPITSQINPNVPLPSDRPHIDLQDIFSLNLLNNVERTWHQTWIRWGRRWWPSRQDGAGVNPLNHQKQKRQEYLPSHPSHPYFYCCRYLYRKVCNSWGELEICFLQTTSLRVSCPWKRSHLVRSRMESQTRIQYRCKKSEKSRSLKEVERGIEAETEGRIKKEKGGRKK